MIRRDRNFDGHSDDAIYLAALGRSDPPRPMPDLERCAMPERYYRLWDDLTESNFDWSKKMYAEIRNEQKRIARKRRWRRVGRTAIALGWLVVLGAAITYIAVTLVIGA